MRNNIAGYFLHTIIESFQRFIGFSFLYQLIDEIDEHDTVRITHASYGFVEINIGIDIYSTPDEFVHHIVIHFVGIDLITSRRIFQLHWNYFISHTCTHEIFICFCEKRGVYGRCKIYGTFPASLGIRTEQIYNGKIIQDKCVFIFE